MLGSRCLEVEIAGLKLHNPTMLASGILGITASSLRQVARAGAGAVVTKSIGLEQREAYKNPTTVQVECGLINAMGLPNPGIEEFKAEIEEAKGLEVPLVVSIYGFSAEEYAKVASVAVEAGADAVELNLSCPHVEGTGTEMGQDPTVAAQVVGEVKRSIRKPVLVKLTPNVSNIADVAVAAADAGADALTAINTVRAMKIDVETALPVLSNKVGGLSGAAIKPIAVRCVYEIYEAVEVPVIGCGGISTWQDALEFMLAGASAAQIGTAIAYEDLGIFGLVTEGIAAYLRKKGHRSVEEIVGLSHRN